MRRWFAVVAGVAVLGLLGTIAFLRAQSGTPVKPRLAVLVVFDQFRGDYLARWGNLFGEGGLKRLTTEGAWFQNCHYPYASTETGVGHSSLMTGCSPDTHGIIGNNWYDRIEGTRVYCATTARYESVPARESKGPNKPEAGSPERLLVPTLADVLKEATQGAGRVVSLSLKDRSAILPAGRTPDACYWLQGDSAAFGTSTFYRARIHDWVAEFNKLSFADQWFGKNWTRLRADISYRKLSGRDDVAAEGTGTKQGRTFPHPMTGGLKKPGKEYYTAVGSSPFGNNLLLEFAKKAIAAEGLGTRDTPDLLCVSFSSNDLIGHQWGPDSQEVMDVTLRSDLIIKELLTYLDEKVGKGRYVLVLSADHGVAPIPEVAKAQGKDAGRISPDTLGRQARAFLQEKFNKEGEKGDWIEAFSWPWVYLDRKRIAERGADAEEMEKALADWFTQRPGILTATTRTRLSQKTPPADEIEGRVRKAFHSARSGDVAVVVKPYYQITQYLTGTGHGTPHTYDTHVPLLVFGTGVRPGIRPDAVTPQAAAAIFAHALGIKPPSSAHAPVPEKLFTAP